MRRFVPIAALACCAAPTAAPTARADPVYEAGVAGGAAVLAGDAALLLAPWAGARSEDFAVALQVPLRFVPAEGRLRAADWDQRAEVGRLLRHARLGSPGETRGLRLGVVSDVTLGQGTLVRRFHNGVDDDHHRTGAFARAESGLGGATLLIDHALGAPVAAGRATLAVLPRLRLGVTVAVDTAAPEPRGGTTVLTGYGADASLRLGGAGAGRVAHADLTLDLNRLGDSAPALHLGVHLGLRPAADWRLALRAEGARLGAGYAPSWFDTRYLVDRHGPATALRPSLRATYGGRLGVEVDYARALVAGAEYGDALVRGRSELSGWLAVPTDMWDVAGSYHARLPGQGDRARLIDPREALAALAVRRRLTDHWWLGAGVARSWRGVDAAAPREAHTEGSLALEAAAGW